MATLSTYSGKTVLVTGHLGFKGAWLSRWLTQLGASVIGLSTTPSYTPYLGSFMTDCFEQSIVGNIDDLATVEKVFKDTRPDVVFHLAAQSLVIPSYQDPVGTFQTNTMGTIHILQAIRHQGHLTAGVFITTDKCYDNTDQAIAFTEAAPLGGHDPYAASKAMAELAVKAYRQSYFDQMGIPVATARAGNVIGGGDFSPYRLIPDVVRSLSTDQWITLRSPASVRPWQHVLDVTYGYLLLGDALMQSPKSYPQALNFSPPADARNVDEMVHGFLDAIGQPDHPITYTQPDYHEARFLQLDSSQALTQLGWQSRLDVSAMIEKTAQWYHAYLNKAEPRQLVAIIDEQIQTYCKTEGI